MSSNGWPRPFAEHPACGFSTSRPIASHNRSVFTLVGDAPALKAATLALFECAVAYDRSPDAPGGASAARRGGRRAVRPDRRGDDGRLRGAGEGCRRHCRRALCAAGLPLRGCRHRSGTAQPRGHPARRVRRAPREDGDARLDTGFRPGGTPRIGRRRRHRRAHAADRLQHQPEHRPAGRRKEDCRRDPPQHRRPALRQGDGRACSKTAASRRSR